MDQAEALLACTGLRKILAGRPPSKAEIVRSVNLEPLLKRLVTDYLQGRRVHPEPEGNIDLPAKLPEDSHDAMGGLDPEVAVGYGIAAGRALQYLNNLIPKRALPSLTEKTADRTASEKAQMRRVLQAVNNPLGVLGDVASMTDDQIAALKAVYPTMWSALGLASSEAMADVDRELSSREERVLGRLLGVAVGDVQSIQTMYRQEEKEQRTGGAGGGPAGPEMATATQTLAAK
jgi:hypothetical protein